MDTKTRRHTNTYTQPHSHTDRDTQTLVMTCGAGGEKAKYQAGRKKMELVSAAANFDGVPRVGAALVFVLFPPRHATRFHRDGIIYTLNEAAAL